MITIYSKGSTEYLPREIIGRTIEDCHEWQFVVDLMRWFVSEVSGPLKLLAVIAILWPVILYG